MTSESLWKRPRNVALAMALALGLGTAGFAEVSHLGYTHAPLALKLASSSEGPSTTGFAPVVRKVLPAVVNVASTKISKMPTEFEGGQGSGPDDPMFRQFFGNPFGDQGGDQPGDRGADRGGDRGGNGNSRRFEVPQQQMPQQREQGLGSGVIMTPDGYIVTNNHVVDGASEVKVTLGDKREFKAKVIGTDPKSDIAVIKIDASELPTITVADSSKVQVGDYALAIGDPFGVGQSVTMGIVSAMGRSHLGIEEYEDFIQTDAPINPGNSGGALVNDRGELIGINTAIIAHGSEGNQGIGFAIPANMAQDVMQQIVEHGKVTRAYLGVSIQDITPSVAKAFGENEPHGALVGDVSADGPAAKAGIERGDIITEVDGRTVSDSNTLRMAISMKAPGTTVNLKLLRNGSEKAIAAKLADLPGTETASATSPSEHGNGSAAAAAGISVEELTPDIAREAGVSPATHGVVVTKVDPSSAAADSGLERGDVIQEVNRQPVKNTADFERAMRASKDSPLLLVNRKGNTLYLAS